MKFYERIAMFPAYEPPESVVSYATHVLHASDALVVNDGSGREYNAVFKKISIPRYCLRLSCTGDPLFCDYLNGMLHAENFRCHVSGFLLSVYGPAQIFRRGNH